MTCHFLVSKSSPSYYKAVILLTRRKKKKRQRFLLQLKQAKEVTSKKEGPHSSEVRGEKKKGGAQKLLTSAQIADEGPFASRKEERVPPL